LDLLYTPVLDGEVRGGQYSNFGVSDVESGIGSHLLDKCGRMRSNDTVKVWIVKLVMLVLRLTARMVSVAPLHLKPAALVLQE
jgi:hypothetical protein